MLVVPKRQTLASLAQIVRSLQPATPEKQSQEDTRHSTKKRDAPFSEGPK
jgi:hypothetical protein